MRVAPRIVTLLASTAPLAVEAFSFLAFPLRIADQEHRHGWLRIVIHGDGRRFSQLCLSSTRQLQLAA